MAVKTNIITLNYPDFDETLSGNLVLVDFWAEWCEPCKVLDPIIEDIAGKYNGKLLVGKVNTGDNRLLANKYGVMNIPAMILFKDGEKVHHFTGLQPKESILSVINKYI
jgi:thioredoxin 1